MERTSKTYVIITDDGPFNRGCYLSWTTEDGGYFTTVDSLDEVNEFDFYNSVEDAEARAQDANSSTWGGWQYPMSIMEVLNFNEAYNEGEEPELVEIKTISFN